MKKLILASIFSILALNIYASGTDPLYKSAPVNIRQTNARPDLPGTLRMDIGLNLLQNEPVAMENNIWGSKTVNFTYSYELPLGNFGLFFSPGIGIGMDRYKFDNDFTLAQNTDGVVTFNDISDIDPKKSLLIVNYVDIPLEFTFYVNPNDKKRSFNVSVGGKFGVRFASQTKLKFEDGDEKVKLKQKRAFGLNPFRYGITTRLGFGGFNLWGYFSLSELFEDGPDSAVDTSNMTFGLAIDLF